LNCGGFRRLFRCLTIIGTTFAITWGTAVAAPPSEPPGKSEHATGQQKQDANEPGPSEFAPRQEKKDDVPAATPPGNGNGTYRNAERPAKPRKTEQQSTTAPAMSPRYVNAQGKPKRNVPAVAETAPAASASAPGKSGIHKLTICHKGHAITVDVHAIAAHMKHGDTFLPAGTKGRAACGPRRSHANAQPPATDVTDPAVRSHPRAVSSDSGSSERSATSSPADALTTAVAPTRTFTGESADAVKTTNPEASDVISSLTDDLPFTGSMPWHLVMAGLVLIALGCVLIGRGSPSRLLAESLDPGGADSPKTVDS
jgi:hypothetical protein